MFGLKTGLKVVLPFFALGASAVHAEVFDNRYYGIAMGQRIFSDGDRVAKDGVGGALGIGMPLLGLKSIRFEPTLFSDSMDQATAPAAPGKYKQSGLMLDFLWMLSDSRTFQPYLGFGMGAVRNRLAALSDNNAMFSLGMGADIRLASFMKLRADLRYRLDELDRSRFGRIHNQYGDTVASLGLLFPFGPEPRAEIPEAPVPEPVPEAAVVTPAPRDSDGDGVMDDADRCPASPVGARVNAEGCEPDSDGDGVVDSKDACPGTPAGSQVDTTGCAIAAATPPAKEVIGLKGVNFYTNSANLTPESSAILDNAAEVILARKLKQVEVAGHTDSRGSDEHNQALSQGRSESVMQYLLDKGVPAGVLTAKGYGESEPVGDNTSKEGQDANRRVELRVAE